MVQKLPPEVEESLSFVSDFGRVIQFYKLYPETHPFIKEGSERAFQKLVELFMKRKKVTIGVAEGSLFIEDKQVPAPPISCKELIGIFERLQISSVILSSGITRDEFIGFIKDIVAADKRVLSGEMLDSQEALRTYPHIEHNLFSYKKVTTKEDEALEKVKETAQILGRDEADIIDMFLSTADHELDSMGANMILGIMEDDPDRFSSLVLEALKKAEESREGSVFSYIEQDVEGFSRLFTEALRSSHLEGAESAADEIERLPDEFASDFVDGLRATEEETGIPVLKLMKQNPVRFGSVFTSQLKKTRRWHDFLGLLERETAGTTALILSYFERTLKRRASSVLETARLHPSLFIRPLTASLKLADTDEAEVLLKTINANPKEFSSHFFDELKKAQEEEKVSFEELPERIDVVASALTETLRKTGVPEERIEELKKGMGLLSAVVTESLDDLRKEAEASVNTKVTVKRLLSRVASAMVRFRNASTEDIEATLSNIIKRLPPKAVKTLFGEDVTTVGTEGTSLIHTLSRRLRTKAFMNDLLKDYSETELSSVLKKMVRYSSEIADIASILAEEMKDLPSGHQRDELMLRFIRAVKSGSIPQRRAVSTALIVDADPTSIANARKVFYEMGFTVREASDASKALDFIKENRPDIVVLEVKLPGDLSGLDVLRALRPSRTPVILATRYESFKTDFEVESYPRKEFLLKPVTEKILEEAVERLLPKEEQEQAVIQLVDSEELSEAEKIQRSLLPKRLPRIAGFHIAVAYAPCKGVSGDYYDIIDLGDGRFGVLLCDVSGKGISAAMVMVLVRTLFRTAAPFHDSPRSTLIHLNTLLSREMMEGVFVSGIYGIIDPKTRTITVANAGHCLPLFWSVKRDTVEIETLKVGGMVMGLLDGSAFSERLIEGCYEFEPDVGVLFYSDGITEAMNEQKREFGEERLLEVTRAGAIYEPERLIANIYGAIQMFRGDAPQSDDMTMVCIKCTG